MPKVPIHISFPQELLKSLDDYIGVDGGKRSSYLATAVKEKMERDQQRDMLNSRHKKMIETVTFPKAKKFLKGKDFAELLELWGGVPDVRNELREHLGVNDDDTKLVVDMIMRIDGR